jgi:hypothetical protein
MAISPTEVQLKMLMAVIAIRNNPCKRLERLGELESSPSLQASTARKHWCRIGARKVVVALQRCGGPGADLIANLLTHCSRSQS